MMKRLKSYETPKLKANVENIRTRNEFWKQAGVNANEMEHERLECELNTILSKDTRATSIPDLLETRVAKLEALAGESVKGVKREIYAKDSTGGTQQQGRHPVEK